MTRQNSLITPIKGVIKNYPWGSHMTLAKHRGEIRSDQPEAELWFGDHPAGPAQIIGSTDTLDQVTSHLGSLPYLAKILAVEHPLSLQVHPGLDDIPTLKNVLKDENHKPELVVALTEFHALVGLAPRESAMRLIEQLSSPKVEVLLAQPLRHGRSAVEILEQLLGFDDTSGILEEVRECVSNLDSRHQKWLLELIELYAPKLDPLALLLCDLVVLNPGENIYLPPRCIHAYLHGTVVEVMANSDNVVRGGLTNKPIEKKNFLALVDAHSGEAIRINPEVSGDSTRWCVPIDDFALQRLNGDLDTTIQVDEYAIAFTWTGSVEISLLGAGREDGNKAFVIGNRGVLLAPGTYALAGRASLWVVTGKGR
jgi:mannose-6-phosphate isomerase